MKIDKVGFIRSNRRSKRLTSPVTGETLRSLVRVPKRLTQSQIAREYRGGVSHVRIVQIERQTSVSPEVEASYRKAVAAAVIRRDRARATFVRSCFENPKSGLGRGQ